jgi:hypothetical protein
LLAAVVEHMRRLVHAADHGAGERGALGDVVPQIDSKPNTTGPAEAAL